MSASRSCAATMAVLLLACICAAYVPRHVSAVQARGPRATDDFAEAQQHNTLQVMQAFAAAMPAMGWSGDVFCAWAGVRCSGTAVTIAPTGASATGTLPEMPDGVDYAQVTLATVNFAGLYGKISGTLPATWGKLAHIKRILLSSTSVSGSLPVEWSSLSELTQVSVSFTKVNGSLPAEWSAMGSLTTFTAASAALTGSLPAEWSSMPSIATITLDTCRLSGTLPAAWAQMPALVKASMYGNSFCGCMPAEWAALSPPKFYVANALTAADCATANACDANSTTTSPPTSTPTTTPAPTSTPNPVLPSGSGTSSSTGDCEVRFCARCVTGSPMVCETCESGYTLTEKKTCRADGNGGFAALSLRVPALLVSVALLLVSVGM